MADADANAAALKRQVRPSQVWRIFTKILGCVVCWFLIFWALMFWIALIPIAATTDAPVWARSSLPVDGAPARPVADRRRAAAAAAADDD